jgi:hypothetical protein
MTAGKEPVLVRAYLEEVIRQLEEIARARSDALGLTLLACARRLRVALLLGQRIRYTALSSLH